MIQRLSLVAGILIASFIVGCASKFPTVDSNLSSAQTEVSVPPKEMVQTARFVSTAAPFSMQVLDEGKGTMVVGYQNFPGEWHVARRWQERTKYRITIIPDFDEPAARCLVQVRELTEQRAAEGMKWTAAPELQHPERSEKLLEAIRNQVKAGGSAAK